MATRLGDFLKPEKMLLYTERTRRYKGKPMNAQSDYIIRMLTKDLPPAGPFWSMTLCDVAKDRLMLELSWRF